MCVVPPTLLFKCTVGTHLQENSIKPNKKENQRANPIDFLFQIKQRLYELSYKIQV